MLHQSTSCGEGAITEQDRADQKRHVAYMRRALPRELLRRGVDWKVDVRGDDRAITGWVSRGKLRLERAIKTGTPTPEDWPHPWSTPTGQPYWWYPVAAEHAAALTRDLADLLHRAWSRYRAADEAGCLHIVAWREPKWGAYASEEFEGGERTELRLAPGVCRTKSPKRDEIRLWSEEHDASVDLTEALALGWAVDPTAPPSDPMFAPDRSHAAAARQEREARRRVARLVWRYIKQHPAVQPLHEAGHEPIICDDSRAIWASAIRQGRGYELEVEIRHPDWWVPVGDTPEGWAARLTTRLARGIREQWDARVRPEGDSP